jgi:hypothetical protein
MAYNQHDLITWAVQLAGDPSDLSAFAQSFTGADINISRDGRDCVLSSIRFHPSDDAVAVRKKAKDIVALLNGASRLVMNATQSIGIGAVYLRRQDGTRDTFFFTGPTLCGVGIRATIQLTHPDGTIEFYPADEVKQLATLALSDKAVAKVLRFILSSGLDWVNLYRIYEIIEADVD